jgi:mono/diheme cytochrome c family protein
VRVVALGFAVLVLVMMAAAADGEVKAGRQVFAAKCSKCHDAESKIYKTGPGLKGIKDGELPSGERADADAIRQLIEDGREEMPPFGNELTEKQKVDVIAYVLTL